MLRCLITRFASVCGAPRAAAVLLAVGVTLNCATPPPPEVEMRPTPPAEMEAPSSAASSAPEVAAEPQAPPPEIAPPVLPASVSDDAAGEGTAGPVSAPPAAPEPAPPAREMMAAQIDARIDDLLRRMTIEQKVGQRFMTWIPGTAASERTAALIEQAHVGGVILIERNVESYRQMRELITGLQRMAQAAGPPVPLFIATDQEGGRVSRVRLPEMTLFPAAFHQGVHADPDYVEAAAYVTGVELRRLGVNVNLAPTIDVYGEPDDTLIGDRSFGANARLVADLGGAYVRGADRAGVISVAKHFPGHGVTSVNSHSNLPVVRLTGSERSSTLAPFNAAIDAGVDVIMVAHVLYEDLDPNRPASVSPTIISGLLRDQLGFDGVVMTDAIEIVEPAPALRQPDIVRNSFAAGADIILAGRESDVLPLVQEAIRLVRTGLHTEERLDESVRRILRVKLAAAMTETTPGGADATASPAPAPARSTTAEAASGAASGAGDVIAAADGTPAAPATLAAIGTDGAIELVWDDAGDAGIIGYEFRVRTDREHDWRRWRPIPRSSATTTGHRLSGLTNGVVYRVQLRALNARGAGAFDEAWATPRAPRTGS